jgi:hypothetical protein
VTTRRTVFLALSLLPSCFPASLTVSSYFKDGFTPAAIASAQFKPDRKMQESVELGLYLVGLSGQVKSE